MKQHKNTWFKFYKNLLLLMTKSKLLFAGQHSQIILFYSHRIHQIQFLRFAIETTLRSGKETKSLNNRAG